MINGIYYFAIIAYNNIDLSNAILSMIHEHILYIEYRSFIWYYYYYLHIPYGAIIELCYHHKPNHVVEIFMLN